MFQLTITNAEILQISSFPILGLTFVFLSTILFTKGFLFLIRLKQPQNITLLQQNLSPKVSFNLSLKLSFPE